MLSKLTLEVVFNIENFPDDLIFFFFKLGRLYNKYDCKHVQFYKYFSHFCILNIEYHSTFLKKEQMKLEGKVRSVMFCLNILIPLFISKSDSLKIQVLQNKFAVIGF